MPAPLSQLKLWVSSTREKAAAIREDKLRRICNKNVEDTEVRSIEAVSRRLQGAWQGPAVHFEDRRDLRLDVCRGLALWFIFIDHIAGNAFA